jgi:nucleoside-diphosphate-sugar epimerase
MGETLCNAYFHQFNLPVKSVRIHHTYGPTMDYKNDSRVFSEFVRNIVYGEDIEIKSDGSATRSFCYISDATEAFFKILLEGEDGGVYNMGNSNEYLSIKELAELLIKNYDKKNIKLIFQERKNDKAYTPSDTTKTAPVNTKKLEKLGWNAEVSVSQGFRKTISAIKMDNKMNN